MDEQIEVHYVNRTSKDGINLSLIGLGFPHDEAVYFEKSYQNSETLLTVSSTNRIDEVMVIITNNRGDIGFDAYEKNANDQNMHPFNDEIFI